MKLGIIVYPESTLGNGNEIAPPHELLLHIFEIERLAEPVKGIPHIRVSAIGHPYFGYSSLGSACQCCSPVNRIGDCHGDEKVITLLREKCLPDHKHIPDAGIFKKKLHHSCGTPPKKAKKSSLVTRCSFCPWGCPARDSQVFNDQVVLLSETGVNLPFPGSDHRD